MNLIARLLVVIPLLFTPNFTLAHSGGQDSNGCHRESATNTRHCHNGPSTSSSSSDSSSTPSSSGSSSSGGSSGGGGGAALLIAVGIACYYWCTLGKEPSNSITVQETPKGKFFLDYQNAASSSHSFGRSKISFDDNEKVLFGMKFGF